MDTFYESNPGLASRIANHVHFPDYSPEELVIIAKMMLEEQQYKLTPEAENVLLQYIVLRMEQPLFANARSAKNALDRARMRQANRIFETSADQVLTKTDLVTLLPEDFLKSRLFNNPTIPAAYPAPTAGYNPGAGFNTPAPGSMPY
jgi:hypothetical protein